MRFSFGSIALALMVTSCSPRVITSFQKVYTPSLPTSEEVVVIETTDPSKAQGEFLGQIKITDTGFTATSNGTYSQVVNLAKYETWKAGGNLMIINQHQLPDAWSTIHRINALAFKTDTIDVPTSTYFYANDPSIQYQMASNSNPTVKLQEPGVIARIYAGAGKRTNKISPDLDAASRVHIKRLQSGVLYGTDITYFAETGYGLGGRFQVLHSSTSEYGYLVKEDDTYNEGIIDETINLTFIGPIISFRGVSPNQKHAFMTTFGIGVLRYVDTQEFKNLREQLRGNSLGLTYDLAYAFNMTDKLSLGADLNYTTGMLKNLVYEHDGKTEGVTLDEDHWEGLSHLSLSVSLSYTF